MFNGNQRDASIIDTLLKFSQNKKSGYERESAAIGFQYLASVLGSPSAPILLPHLPTIMDLYMDKGDVVRIAATAATKTILRLLPPEATRIAFRHLEDILEKGKWRTKVGALDAIRGFVDRARDEVGSELVNVLPKVEMAMHDTKPEASCSSPIISRHLNDVIGIYCCQEMRDNSVLGRP